MLRLRTLFALMVAPAIASADPPPSDRAGAESLHDAGLAAMAAGRLAEACAQLAESQRMAPDASTLLDLATCHEREGRLASAWTELREAERGQSARGIDTTAIRARIAALDPQVPRLVIVVTSRGAQPLVRRDGQPVMPVTWGVPVAVDPGEHVIETEAGIERTSLLVRAIPGKVIRVEVPARAVSGGDGSAQRTLGFIVGAAGLATIGGGIALRLAANARHRDGVDQCNAAPGGLCTDAARNAQSDAEGMATLSGATLGLGIIGVIAGGALIFTADGKPAPRTAVRLVPTITTTSAGLSFGGSL